MKLDTYIDVMAAIAITIMAIAFLLLVVVMTFKVMVP